jgi:anti-anti-sigma factor
MAIMREPRAFYGRLHEHPIVVLKGNIRYMTARALRGFIDELVTERNDAIILDLRELEAIDSTGMGLLARVGRSTLEHGRRSVIVCNAPDVTMCLKSVAFDRLFVMLQQWPFPEEPEVAEVPVQNQKLDPDALGRVVLDAHRELASLSDTNQREFGGVISRLEAELSGDRPRGHGSCAPRKGI